MTQEGYDESAIYRLEKQKNLVITRKRDGWKVFAVMGRNNKVRLYTDGLNEIDSRLDHIKKDLRKIKLLAGLVLVGEVLVDVEGSDDIGKVISIFHSSTSKSIEFQSKNGKAKFMIFGAFSLEGYSMSIESVWEVFSKDTLEFVFPAPIIRTSYDQAKMLVIKNGWEGLVLYTKDHRLTYRLDGKAPRRTDDCLKWKPISEDDFIVRSWRPSSSNPKLLKDIVLSQIDPTTGKEFECGKLGSFSNQMRLELARAKYPFVVQAAFEMRFPKTGKIRNARFLRVRTDKPIDQCIAPKSYKK